MTSNKMGRSEEMLLLQTPSAISGLYLLFAPVSDYNLIPQITISQTDTG